MEAYQEILNAIRNNDLTFLDSEETEAVFDVAKIRQICEELAAVKEKYRWRKQSEEPVGDSLEDDAPVECLDMEYGIPTTRVTECKIVGPEEYWRPLDLPAEEM